MKKEKEPIDILLKKNESEQLSGINWEQLQSSISKKLDEAGHAKTSIIIFRRLFKIAAGAVATAAVIFIAIMIKTNIPTEGRFENSDKGMMTFIENIDSAKVKILDSNVQDNQAEGQPAWIIIRKSEPKVADNGHSRDEMDFACLM